MCRLALQLRVDEVHRGRPDESGDEQVVRPLVEVKWRVDLLEHAVLQHGHPVAHRHRLDLVVRDVHGRDAEPALEGGDLRPGRDAQLRVEVRQRLVHEEDLGLTNDGSPHRDPLALTTGQGLRLALEELLEPEELRGVSDLPHAIGLGDPSHLEREAHVVGHGHVRVERVVLEDHRDVAVLGRQMRDVAVADRDTALVDLLEPCEHPQRRRLPAAGRSDEHHELAVPNLEVELVDRGRVGPRVDPCCLCVIHTGHEASCSFHRQERAGRSVVGASSCAECLTSKAVGGRGVIDPR